MKGGWRLIIKSLPGKAVSPLRLQDASLKIWLGPLLNRKFRTVPPTRITVIVVIVLRCVLNFRSLRFLTRIFFSKKRDFETEPRL